MCKKLAQQSAPQKRHFRLRRFECDSDVFEKTGLKYFTIPNGGVIRTNLFAFQVISPITIITPYFLVKVDHVADWEVERRRKRKKK
jgi:hypothetical protein